MNSWCTFTTKTNSIKQIEQQKCDTDFLYNVEGLDVDNIK